MAVNNMSSIFWQQFGGQIVTKEINFAPAPVFVTAALSYTSGGGAQFAGIASIRSRPNPDGPEVPEFFGQWFEWRSTIFRPRLTSVTLGLATGKDQGAQGLFTFFDFS